METFASLRVGKPDHGEHAAALTSPESITATTPSIVTLVSAIAGIALSGRDNGAVRYLGYATFAVETLYLASETIGSIIGTSGFFLVAGLVVAMIAWAVIALERRFSRNATGAEA